MQENGNGSGILLGNYVNANLPGTFNGIIVNDPLFMHEFGHTFDSERFGPLYLPVVGISSALSASKATYDYSAGR